MKKKTLLLLYTNMNEQCLNIKNNWNRKIKKKKKNKKKKKKKKN